MPDITPEQVQAALARGNEACERAENAMGIADIDGRRFDISVRDWHTLTTALQQQREEIARLRRIEGAADAVVSARQEALLTTLTDIVAEHSGDVDMMAVTVHFRRALEADHEAALERIEELEDLLNADSTVALLRASNEKAKRNRDNWKARALALERVATAAKRGCHKCQGEDEPLDFCREVAGCGFADTRKALDALTAVKSPAVPTTSEDM